jgi:hypothetical protein
MTSSHRPLVGGEGRSLERSPATMGDMGTNSGRDKPAETDPVELPAPRLVGRVVAFARRHPVRVIAPVLVVLLAAGTVSESSWSVCVLCSAIFHRDAVSLFRVDVLVRESVAPDAVLVGLAVPCPAGAHRWTFMRAGQSGLLKEFTCATGGRFPSPLGTAIGRDGKVVRWLRTRRDAGEFSATEIADAIAYHPSDVAARAGATDEARRRRGHEAGSRIAAAWRRDHPGARGDPFEWWPERP